LIGQSGIHNECWAQERASTTGEINKKNNLNFFDTKSEAASLSFAKERVGFVMSMEPDRQKVSAEVRLLFTSEPQKKKRKKKKKKGSRYGPQRIRCPFEAIDFDGINNGEHGECSASCEEACDRRRKEKKKKKKCYGLIANSPYTPRSWEGKEKSKEKRRKERQLNEPLGIAC
jgi:hypothetical protein